ncbi:MAG: penicillin binding protein PBP4B [Butyrivibrio sp.]|nr:penicillin binding protein PBP4B [Butyrivibrio sp.]
MKKLTALTMATLMAIALVSCGSTRSADEGRTELTSTDNSIYEKIGADDTSAEAGGMEEEVKKETVKERGTTLKPKEAGAADTDSLIKVTFPDWRGYTDNTLAMNSIYSFAGFERQGKLYFKTAAETAGFDMYINGRAVDVTEVSPGSLWMVDFSDCAKNGENSVQVTNVSPSEASEAVTVYIPYPEVIDGTLDEVGIHPETLTLISDLIESDIENGFSSAQLAVIKNGMLVYENAWGLTNSFLPDGSPCTDSPQVTTDTLYDLASVTKMFSVNYALQKLLTDGEVDLDAKITDFLGDEFVEKTIEVPIDTKGEKKEPGVPADLQTIKKWKSELTIRELLMHQGGFPADPKYCAPKLYKENLLPGEDYPDNPLFAGNEPDVKTRLATIDMICKTPLDYEPGTKTVYSDVDYMILGLVVERITGDDLDHWLKKTFYEPMGLTHITYNPLQNGFDKDDCAATELNGNTRDGLLDFKGYRTGTIQGEVHDEKAFYCMGGVSGHAGLFSNATDLAKLANVMLSGGYGENRFFSHNAIDLFTAPKAIDAANWGLGWWRQGDGQRVWYFGTQAGSGTFGHQGWTGTLAMIDPDRQLVVVYLTNKINTRITDKQADANKFNGGWYTASTLGFVPQILSIGMDSDEDVSNELQDLTRDMVIEARKLIPDGVSLESDHPAVKNYQSKLALSEKYK